MAVDKTPGVYVSEIDASGRAVVQLPSSEPAFLGCTANGPATDVAGDVVPGIVWGVWPNSRTSAVGPD